MLEKHVSTALFRDRALALRLVSKIKELAKKAVKNVELTPLKIMDFCGTH